MHVSTLETKGYQ
uniref:Uncharacterized protein n=1 Tax=Rhizophora mucronata TaxID=61149 RepID=A0A2P2INW2_RHIMU